MCSNSSITNKIKKKERSSCIYHHAYAFITILQPLDQFNLNELLETARAMLSKARYKITKINMYYVKLIQIQTEHAH